MKTDISRREWLSIVGYISAPLSIRQSTNSGTSSWPQYQYNSSNTGYNASVSGPVGELQEQWSVDPEGVAGTPIIVDDTVYTKSGDTEFSHGNVVAFDRISGESQWISDEKISTNLVYGNGMIFFGHNPDFSTSSIYAIEPSDGETIWSFDLPNDYQKIYNLIYDGGNIYFESSDDSANIYSLDTETGSTNWKSSDFPEAHLGAVADEKLFVGGYEESRAINVNSGEVEWTTDTYVIGAAYSSGTLVAYENDYFGIDSVTGSELWQINSGERTPPALANGTAYLEVNDDLYAVDVDSGEIMWTVDIGELFSAPPVYADGYVYIGTYYGMLFTVDTGSKEVVNKQEFSQDYSPMSIMDGRLYTNTNGGILALSENNKEPRAQIEYSPEDPETGEKVTFSGSKSVDQDGSIVAYEWEFGDNKYESNKENSHSLSIKLGTTKFPSE